MIMELYKGKYWTVVFVDWCQEFPGQCIISNDRTSLSDLKEEWIELGALEKELERICKTCFQATMFNFACLMNNAYLYNTTPHVHFQFLPRYQNKVSILNKQYKDKHFGYNAWKYTRSKTRHQKDIFTKEERLKMYEIMKKEWKKENAD